MDLADTLAIITAGAAFIGGFTGLMVPFIDARDLLDNGQRGFFLGALIGSVGGFVVYLAGGGA